MNATLTKSGWLELFEPEKHEVI